MRGLSRWLSDDGSGTEVVVSLRLVWFLNGW